jgi:hypothetical protein
MNLNQIPSRRKISKIDIDDILTEWSCRLPDGIPDAADAEKLAVLYDVLKENKIDMQLLSEDAAKFERYLKDVLPKKLSANELKIVQGLYTKNPKAFAKLPFTGVKQFTDWMNSIRSSSPAVYESLHSLGQAGTVGRGEIAAVVGVVGAFKTAGQADYDLDINGLKWEVKESAKRSDPIRAGGTYRASVENFTSSLRSLNSLIQNQELADIIRRVDPEFVDLWIKLLTPKTGGEIDFTSIGQDKFSKIKTLAEKFTKLIDKINEKRAAALNTFQVSKNKSFSVDSGDVSTIKKTKTGNTVPINVAVVPTDAMLDKLYKISVLLEKVSENPLFSSVDELQRQIKMDFIGKYTGGLIYIKAGEYKTVTQDIFMNDWEFISLSQGNRPQYKEKQ